MLFDSILSQVKAEKGKMLLPEELVHIILLVGIAA